MRGGNSGGLAEMCVANMQAREGNTRVKSAAGGVVKKEALLDSNKHRKQSRKKVCACSQIFCRE